MYGLRKVGGDQKRATLQPQSCKLLEACKATNQPRREPMKMLVRTLMPTLLICLLAPAAVVFAQDNPPKTVSAQSDAKKAVEKLKTLTGSWQGAVMGMSVNVTIRLASSGTAILHEATGDGKRPPNHEITMFYVDGDRLLATHFCDGGNRVRWEGKMSPDGKTIEFSFLDVAGGTRGGLAKDMVFTIIDADKHAIVLNFIMPDGKSVDVRGEFQRTK
jgi:hypothetical protein